MKNMVKRILAILCAMTIMMSVIALPEFGLKAEAAGGLDLSKMQIVTPASATSVENKAVTELRNYIKSITGVSLTVKKEGQNSGAGIYIGNTQFAKNNGVAYPTEGDEKGEAWAIQAVDGNLVLVGAPKRGVLYAVFHLLEDALGVRWWNIWEEYVPTGDAIVPADYASSGVPAFEYREIFVGVEGTTDYLFYVRNQLNGNHTDINAYYGGEESYGGAHVHTFLRYFSSSEFSAHPEWFSLYNGSRVFDGQLCLTNSGLKDAYAQKLLSRVKGAPTSIHSISPDDNEKFCQCTTCQSAINTYGYSGYILNFVNDMAARVKAAGYTDATIEMLAYWLYEAPPKGGIVPADNVMVRFCGRSADLLHGLNHANNASTLSNLKAWAKLCNGKLYYWQYVVNYYNNGIAPSMFSYGDDAVLLQELGVDGWFAEQESTINTDFWDMKLWLIAQLMENPVSGAEYEALMDEFLYSYYGEAAGKHIRDYLYYMHDRMEATSFMGRFYDNIIGGDWLTVQDIIKGNEYFEKAFAAANGDETLLVRLHRARSGLDRVIVENYVKWQNQAASAGLTLPFTQREAGKRLSITFKEQKALRGAYDPNDLASRYDGYSDTMPAMPSGYNMAAGHYHEHTSGDMDTIYMTRVDDSTSLTGSAIQCAASKYSDIALSSATAKHSLSYTYWNTSGATKSSTIGSLVGSDIKTDQGYQIYTFNWTVPADLVNKNPNRDDYMSMFGGKFKDWRWADELQPFAGKTVTVYLSLRVDGAAYGSGASPTYYIDRIVVKPYSQTNHSYSIAKDPYGVGCRKVCSICGDVQLSSHSWNSGVVTKEPTDNTEGLMTYTCTVCSSTKTEVLPKLDGFTAPGHIYEKYDTSHFDNHTGTVITDADAFQKTAVQLSGLDLTGSDAFKLYRAGNDGQTRLLAERTTGQLKLNQGYQLYRISLNLPEAGMVSGGYVYLFDSQKLQCSAMAQTMDALAGKELELYISMKITGTLENATLCIDRMVAVEPCANYRDGDFCSICGTEVTPSVHEMFNYNYVSFVGPENKYTVVSDKNAYYEKAAVYENMDLSAASVPMYRYEAGNKTCEFIKIGAIANADLKANLNQGYKTYTFEFTLPETGMVDNGYVYFTDSWTIQNHHMGANLKGLAGQTVKVILSMKLEGTSLASTKVSVDRMQIIDSCLQYQYGDLCTKCGRTIAVNPDAHALHTYGYADLSGSTVVTDENAYGGKAKQYTSMNLTTSHKIVIYLYDKGASDATGKTVVHSIGAVPAADVKLNQGYQTYSFTFTVPTGLSGNLPFVYFVDSWGVNCPQMAKDLKALEGKTVTITMSMKAEGTTTSATLYFDKLQILDSCEDHISANGTYCTVCRKSLLDETLPKELQVVSKNHLKRYDTDDIMLKEGESIVDDSESALGKAWTYELEIGNGLDFYRYEASAATELQYLQIAKIAYADIVADAGYVFYKYTVNVPENIAASGDYTYLDWRCCNTTLAQDMMAYAGKSVDIYLSMKVTDVTTDAAGKTYGKVYVDQMILADACNQNWDDGVVTKAPTAEEEGIRTYTCTVCGATKTEPIAKLSAPAASWNLKLDGNIAMNFVLNVTAEQAAAATAEYTVNGVTTKKNVSDLVNSDGKAVLTVELAAAQMADEVKLVVNAGGNTYTKTYSVQTYANYILSNGFDAKIQNLVKYMLAYGSASQTYFGYNTGNLADAGITVEAAAVSGTGDSAQVTGSAKGIKFYGASLVHENKIAVRFYFTAQSIDGLTFSHNVVKKNGLYCVEIADICPQDLDNDLTVSVTDGSSTLRVSYAPLDYIFRMYHKGGSTAALVQALYGYYLAAESYAN